MITFIIIIFLIIAILDIFAIYIYIKRKEIFNISICIIYLLWIIYWLINNPMILIWPF